MCPKLSKSRKFNKVGHLKLQRAEHSDATTVAIGARLYTEALPTSLQWILETGSDIAAIGIRQLSAIGGFTENLANDLDDVRTTSGDQLVSVGTIIATLTASSLSLNTIIHAYKGLEDALPSRQSLCALGFIPPDWPKQVVRLAPPIPELPGAAELNKIREHLLSEFADVFDDSNLKPMVGAPMDIIVNKKGSSEKRLPVDLQTLNRQVKRPTHPMSTARTALSGIGAASWFTKLDARHGY